MPGDTGRCDGHPTQLRNCPRPAEYTVATTRRQVRTCRQHLGTTVADLVDRYADPVTVHYSWQPAHR